MADLPDGLADVVEPLREADNYARLQLTRQRGLYNLLTGLPVPVFLIAQWLTQGLFNARTIERFPWTILLVFLPWILFLLACYPQLFLPWIRRYRPDWQSPLLEANLLRKALDKIVWLQMIAMMGGLMVITLLFGLLVFLDIPEASRISGGLLLLVYGVSIFLLAARMRKLGDRALANGFRFMLLLPFIFIAVAPLLGASFAPAIVYGALYGMLAGLLTPPLAVGLFRLFAPRRWLLR